VQSLRPWLGWHGLSLVFSFSPLSPFQLILAVVAFASAFPGHKFAYQAPGPNDARSPCPGLNTLANHGYINRNGRNIQGSDIINAAQQVYSIAPRFGRVFFVFLSRLTRLDAASSPWPSRVRSRWPVSSPTACWLLWTC
jgi:hypothetical protein